jgi:hypothetical protein
MIPSGAAMDDLAKSLESAVQIAFRVARPTFLQESGDALFVLPASYPRRIVFVHAGVFRRS